MGIVSIGDLVKTKIAEAEAEADGLKAYIAQASLPTRIRPGDDGRRAHAARIGGRVGQAVGLQHVGRGVAGARRSGAAQGAGLQVGAVVAFAERQSRADAGRQRQRAVDHADHLGEADLGGGAGQGVAAELAAAAEHQAVARELQQDGFQELARRVGAQRHFAGGELGALGAGQLHQRAQGVSGFLRQHGSQVLAPLRAGSRPADKGADIEGRTMKFVLSKDGD